jgi:hypothetical protein
VTSAPNAGTIASSNPAVNSANLLEVMVILLFRISYPEHGNSTVSNRLLKRRMNRPILGICPKIKGGST